MDYKSEKTSVLQSIVYELMNDQRDFIDGEKLKDAACYADSLIDSLVDFYSCNVTRATPDQISRISNGIVTLMKLHESIQRQQTHKNHS